MYDELVKRLRDEAESPDNYPEDSILMREAADAIEELQKAVNFHKFNSEFWKDKYNSLADEKWIPVTERLPEEDQHILLWCERVNYKQVVCRSMHLTTIAEAKYQGYTPIAWMPLPEPPKEETE